MTAPYAGAVGGGNRRSLAAPEFAHQFGGVQGAEAAGHVVAGDRLEARHGERLPVLGEAHGVVPGGNVHDAGRVAGGQPVQRRVEQPQPPVGVLVGDGDDPGELGGGLAGAAEDVVAGRDPVAAGEPDVHEHAAVDGCAHADVRGAAPGVHHVADAVLVGGPGEDVRPAAAAGRRAVEQCLVVPDVVRRGAVALRVQVQLGAADRRHQRVGGRPGVDAVRVEVGQVELEAGRAGVTG